MYIKVHVVQMRGGVSSSVHLNCLHYWRMKVQSPQFQGYLVARVGRNVLFFCDETLDQIDETNVVSEQAKLTPPFQLGLGL